MSSTSHLQDQPWSKPTRAQSHTDLASSLAWPPADGVILARTPNSFVLACAGVMRMPAERESRASWEASGTGISFLLLLQQISTGLAA